VADPRDEAELRDIFRMPAVLGPAPGPRNMPRSKAHLRFDGDSLVVSVTALSDAAALGALLPAGCRLAVGDSPGTVRVRSRKADKGSPYRPQDASRRALMPSPPLPGSPREAVCQPGATRCT